DVPDEAGPLQLGGQPAVQHAPRARERAVAALDTGHGPRRGRRPLRAPGGPAGHGREERVDRDQRQRPDRLGRAPRRAGTDPPGLAPRRAQLRPLHALADPARGHRSGGRRCGFRQGRALDHRAQARAAPAAPRGDQREQRGRRRQRCGSRGRGPCAGRGNRDRAVHERGHDDRL
ncbi:MAG: hypothetical protein AVDCRST_MAG45-2135, partial [uncultured Solirubrobacterales bacterium]